jgi:BirA family biotin operon repressor/biotin-[acetyl-CoA-carboxylase] ligase
MELPEVGSTNIYAMERLQVAVAGHGAAFFAHYQYAGKGQHGKNWSAEPGNNIILSVILDTSFLLITQQFHLSIMVALACHDLFSKYAADETKIKWPNDIYWRDRKAGGILVENVIRGNKWQWAVAGTGININQSRFPPNLVNRAVSLKQITGKQYDVVALARELCAAMQQRYTQLQAGEFDLMLAAYNQHLFKKGEDAKLKKDTISFNCTIKEVNANGELLVTDGIQDRFRFGEVSWLL